MNTLTNEQIAPQVARTIRVRRPDDFHVHLREGETLEQILPETALQFGRALVMPNLHVRPILTAEDARWYREVITAHPAAKATGFEPLMTIYLTKATTAPMIRDAHRAGVIAAKYYPKDLTTNASLGVENILELKEALRAMEDCCMVLCIHAEKCGSFVLDREHDFVPSLKRLVQRYPKLRIVVEHVTTERMVNVVRKLPETVAATITVHHLILTLDDVIGGALRPHHFCKPVAKRPRDRAALIGAACSGEAKFFLGTDSAFHPVEKKESDCGCAGVFSAPVAMSTLLEIFTPQRRDALERFTSENGAQFYGLPLNTQLDTYQWCQRIVPTNLYGGRCFRAGEPITWERCATE